MADNMTKIILDMNHGMNPAKLPRAVISSLPFFQAHSVVFYIHTFPLYVLLLLFYLKCWQQLILATFSLL